jgi:threonine synthase
MQFRSILNSATSVSFDDALLRGLAPDGSLYVPATFPRLPDVVIQQFDRWSLEEVAFHVLRPYISTEELSDEVLRVIVKRAINFPLPLVRLEDRISLLELFHGPTLAFKDLGARFMAQVLSEYLAREGRDIAILVATSGDTGSAVAHGFHNVPHITVYVLYPSGKISALQEHQMATLGGNVHAVEVEGTFDDCQRFVKQSLGDAHIRSQMTLTTANSINLARLLPQIVFYAWGVAQWRKDHGSEAKLSVVVPSGNVGNLTAAAYAKRMGIRIDRLVAATNRNDILPQYLQSGTFSPRPSVQTLSNAMDVGNPSNLARLQHCYGNDLDAIRRDIVSLAISDEETIGEVQQCYKHTRHILDPHTAVGVATVRRLLEQSDGSFLVAATAHPAKFPETIQRALGINISIPTPLAAALSRPKLSVKIPASFEAWKELLLFKKLPSTESSKNTS